jgi:molecular chaperone DnaK
MSGRVVGIDLGTTNSEVAARTNEGIVVLTEGGTGILPSVVGVSPDGRLLVGEEALNQLVLHPDRTVRSVKRLMGSAETVPMAGKRYRPQEISAMILSSLKDRAERVLGEPVAGAVITVPAYFSDAQRQATREAGEIAGLAAVRILNEPTAASLAHGEQEHGRTVLVYDLGGGTFDVSVVRIEAGINEVLSSHGDTRLGGDDLDEALLEVVAGRIGDGDLRRKIRMEPRARARMLRAVEEVRRELSTAPFARIREDAVAEVDGVPVHVDLEVTREEFEECARPILERTLKSIHRALEDAGLKNRDLDAVLLAGGATRTPLVLELILEATGLEPRSELHPDLCVAQGAGLLAAREEGSIEARVLVDVTPYSFGPAHVGTLDGEWSPDCYTAVIRRSTPLPVRVTAPYCTHFDEQEKVEVVVYQGEDPHALNNIEIGRFVIEGLSRVPAGNSILIGMDLDLDGILEVTATEKATGLAKTVRIEDAVGRMGKRELEQAKHRVTELTGHQPGAGAEALARDDLPPDARSVVLRYEEARDRLHADDRPEGDALVSSIRAAAAGEEGEVGLGDLVTKLEDLLFYSEGGGE